LLNGTRSGRTLAAAALGVLLAGLFAFGVAVPASAADVGIQGRPTGCHSEVMGNWGTASQCTSHNGGDYRALAVCKGSDGQMYYPEGNWKQYGKSYAYCPGDSVATGAGIETRV
jgi:hypothetical protein